MNRSKLIALIEETDAAPSVINAALEALDGMDFVVITPSNYKEHVDIGDDLLLVRHNSGICQIDDLSFCKVDRRDPPGTKSTCPFSIQDEGGDRTNEWVEFFEEEEKEDGNDDAIIIKITDRLVETGELAEQNAAFICFYVNGAKPYIGAPSNWGSKAINASIPMFAMPLRWDGNLGFIGGNVDEGETLKEAAIREAYEEAGIVVDPDNLELFCSHALRTNKNSHLFLHPLDSLEDLEDIQREALDAEHSRCESAGMNIIHWNSKTIAKFEGGELALAKTVREEIELLVERNIIDITIGNEVEAETE